MEREEEFLDADIPCPNCGENLATSLDFSEESNVITCPHCGAEVTLDEESMQEIIETSASEQEEDIHPKDE